MKKHTGFTASLLAFLMLIGTLSSCAQGDTRNDDTSRDDTTTAQPTEDTAEPEYVAPSVKYDGETFVFSSWTTDSPNWVATSYSEAGDPDYNGGDGDIIDEAIYDRIVAAETATGVTIESRLYTSSADMRTVVMAGDDFADCVIASGSSAATLALNQVLYDLNEIPTLDLSKSWWNQTANEAFLLGGKQYIAAGDISPFCTLAAHCVFFNKGMVADNDSLADPYDAVRNGTWTYDLMEEMATAVSNDVNGDGTMDAEDTFGLCSEAIGMVTVGACGVRFTGKEKDGSLALTLDGERAANAVETIVTLFRNSNIAMYAMDYAADYGNVFRQLFVQKFIEDELLFVNNWLVVALELRDMDSDFGILPPPKMDETQESYQVYHSESWTYYPVVPITIDNPNMVGHVMDALGYYGHEILYSALIDKTVEGKTLRDKDTEEMLQIIYENRIFDPATMFDWGGISGMFNSFIHENSIDFASSYAAIREKILTEMKNTEETFAKIES